MEPQAVIIVLIGSPVVMGILKNRQADGGINLLAFVGLAMFGVGFYFETVADAQLQSFLALTERPRYLNTGVWTHTRHPNYFGTTTVWWGMWLVAVAGNPDCWWTVAGPIVNTIMLTSVLGSAFQDNYMGSRPEYQELQPDFGDRHVVVANRRGSGLFWRGVGVGVATSIRPAGAGCRGSG